MSRLFKDRYIVFTAFIIFMTVIIIARLVNLQIVNGEQYDQQSQSRVYSESRIVAPRGNIIDRNGMPMAVSRQGYTVKLLSVKMKQSERDEMFLKLIDIFERNGDNYKKSLSNYLTFNPLDFGPAIKDNEAAREKWKKEMAKRPEDVELLSDPQSVFEYLRKVKFEISDDYTDEQAYKIMILKYELLIRSYSGINPIASDVSRETVAEIEERHDEFPGVDIDDIPIRQYFDSQAAAHVLGYVRGISDDELKKLKEQGYHMNDIIGKDGIEKSAEKYLRGKDGIKRIEKDINGRPMAELEGKPAEPGSDVMLTIDMNLQKVAYESLVRNIEAAKSKTYQSNNYGDANAGAVVVMDVNSGEVLAMVSYPTYDPSVFLQPASDVEAQKQINKWYSEGSYSPTLNRAIGGMYAPGSTFKPLVAIAGLEEGVITPNSSYYDPGYIIVDGHKFSCLEARDYGIIHGNISLNRALATSCNVFFHLLGIDIGIDKIDKWAKAFGLGERTGIELPGEISGQRANRDTKPKKDGPWGRADTAQVAIGQFSQAYTPIQLANYISTVANGGKKFKPHIIKKVIKYDGTVVPGSEYDGGYEQIPVSPETINAVKEGMVAVATSAEGTASEVFRNFPFKVAAKTGTAETGRANESSNALFVCFAPADDPKVAVAIVMERGAWGANTAPIAADILSQYFGLNDDNKSNDRIRYDGAVFTR